MGFPSYAHPIIGEWSWGEVVVSPNDAWILPEYPTTEYCKFVSASLKSISSPNLSKLLTVKSRIALSTINPDPFGVILTSGATVYPIPGFITFTSVILPSETIALNLAPIPVPIPTKSKSGADVYSFPPNITSHPIIFPSKTIALNSAFLPLRILIFGFFSKFNILEP